MNKYITYLNSLQIYTETWEKDVFELLDYDCQTLISNSMECSSNGYLYRTTNMTFLKNSDIVSSDSEKLLTIIKNSKFFELKPNKLFNNQYSFSNKNSSWLVYKRNKCPEKINYYKLKENDIIKIGRLALRVKEIKLPNNNNYNISNSSSISEEINMDTNNSKNKLLINKNQKKKICRICYGDEDTENSPLIQPCKCSGTMKYIHINCLRKWVGTKMCIKVQGNEYYSFYQIKQIECELCKSKFPDYIRHNEKLYEIIDFQYEYNKYIIFETIPLNCSKEKKYFYLVSFDKLKEIKAGRGHQVEFLLSDVSISRMHFTLINNDDKDIYIMDNVSKFGTLVLLQCPFITVDTNVPLHLQIGKTYAMIKVKKNFNFLKCCSSNEDFDYFCYQKQNSQAVVNCNNVIIKDEVDVSESSCNNSVRFTNDINEGYANINESNNEDINIDSEDACNQHKRRITVATDDIINLKKNENLKNMEKDINDEVKEICDSKESNKLINIPIIRNFNNEEG